jgi:PAS domain S-box-containing protein
MGPFAHLAFLLRQVGSIMEEAPDLCLVLLAPDGAISRWSPGAERMTGYRAEEVVGRPYALQFAAEEAVAGKPERILRDAARKGRTVYQGWRVRKDGSRYPVSGVVAAVRDEDGALGGFVKVTRDVSEREADPKAMRRLAARLERSEAALLQARKLESLGLLAGSIAHDFNNLVAAMQGNLHLARSAPSVGAMLPYHETLAGLMDTAANLVGQMLACVRRGPLVMRGLDMNRLVGDLVQQLRTSISRKAEVRVDLHPGLLTMTGDATQIQQVVMNLVLNASEAMADRAGTILIRTGRDDLTREALAGAYPGQGLEPGPYVALEVSDNGTGMSPDVQERIFDPFFSTKVAGRGLGLAAIRTIVRDHHGGIRVDSSPGRGSRFSLRFPGAGAPP